MGDDWREFRARLVARERASVGGGGEEQSSSATGEQKKKQSQQQRQRASETREDSSSSSSMGGGGIFGALTSMFSNKGGESSSSSSSSSSDAATATRARKTRGMEKHTPVDIFDGSAVGGATEFSKIGMSSSASYSPCSDPFMDEEECQLIHDEPNVRLDKHRWAHPLYHVEPGCILVANEKLGGVFHQTVVLIIDHNEAAGSTGMVINRCVLYILLL